MPWCHAQLRDARVLARCDASGGFVVDGGRVEVRYNPKDGRAYRAAARNLVRVGDSVLPDDHCAEAASPDAANDATSRSAGASKKKPTKSARAIVTASPTVPIGSELIFYADGACSGNPGPAGLGVVLASTNEYRELSEYLGIGTNNVAELTAILRAAALVHDPSLPVRIYTDSLYAIGVLTRGWRAKANIELVERTKAALATLEDAQLIHVRGHAGVELNERADELAREAVQNQQSTGWVTRPR